MRVQDLFEAHSLFPNGTIIELDGGKIDIAPNVPYTLRKASVVQFFVPEESRNQGIGQRLIQQALKEFPQLGAQVSSLASLKAFYNQGFRNPNLVNDEFDVHVRAFHENGDSLFVSNCDVNGNSYV